MTRFRTAQYLLPMLLLSAGTLNASSPSFSEPHRYFDFQPCSGTIYVGPGETGGVGCAAGKFRNGAVFDGSDDAVIAPGSNNEGPITTFTISAWVKPASGATLGTRTIAGKEGSFKLEIVDNTYRLSVRLANGALPTISKPIPNTGWTHVAGVYDGKEMAIFVSGQDLYRPVDAAIAATAEPFVIGNNPSGTGFAGSLDEVKLWRNEALTKRQIHELASMLPRPDSGAPGSTSDADLTLVAKSPRLAYDANPNVPAPGSNVAWEAHVRNRGSVALTNLRVQWYLDGTYLGATNVASIAPGGEATTTWNLPWSAADQYLAVWADPQNVVTEVSERNNYRLVRTNSLMVGFWVEQSTRDYFDAYQLDYLRSFHLMADEGNSFEDWAQRQIDRYNWALANPALPVASNRSGLDRVRLDQIIVVPDGSLPLASGTRKTNYPDTSDKTVDMMWGFPAPVDPAHYDRTKPTSAFYTEQGLVHELNHARFLVDTYALNLHRQMVGVENGVGYQIYPHAPGGLPVYRTSAAGGMMEGQNFRYAEWEIDWLNLYAGQRPLPGWANFNAHQGLYEYLHLLPALPAQNRLKILDSSGQPLAGAKVYMYQSVPQHLPEETYPRWVDNVPELVATVPASGEIAIGQNPFSVADIWGYNFQYCVNFIRIVYNGHEFYSGIDLANLQVAYFRGQQSLAVHPIATPFALGKSSPDDLRIEGGIAPLTFIDQCLASDANLRNEWRVRNDGSGWANLTDRAGVEYGSCGVPSTTGIFPMRLFQPATLPGRIIQCAPSGQMRHVYELTSPTLAPYLESYHDDLCP
jgi:hypothetical protein